MDEREREVIREEPVVERHRTTVINTGGEGGGGGTALAVVLVIGLLVVLFLLFGRGLMSGSDETKIDVKVDTPDINLPAVPGNSN